MFEMSVRMEELQQTAKRGVYSKKNNKKLPEKLGKLHKEELTTKQMYVKNILEGHLSFSPRIFFPSPT